MAWPWSAGDQLNAADLNAAFNIKLLKKNSGGPISSSNVDLDTVSITGLAATDILVVHTNFAANNGAVPGFLSLQNNTDGVTLIDDLTSNGSTFQGWLKGIIHINQAAGTGTTFVLTHHWWQANSATDATSRDKFTKVTGNTAGFTGTWTLALHKGTDGGGSQFYWQWQVLKLFN